MTPIIGPRYFLFNKRERRFVEVSKLRWKEPSEHFLHSKVRAVPYVQEDEHSIQWGYDLEFRDAYEEVFAKLQDLRFNLPKCVPSFMAE